MSIATIQSELLNLPVNERLRMIDVLWASVTDAEIKTREAAWAAESERRIDAFDSVALTARDAATVFADLKGGMREARNLMTLAKQPRPLPCSTLHLFNRL